jgi:hypothetical protein
MSQVDIADSVIGGPQLRRIARVADRAVPVTALVGCAARTGNRLRICEQDRHSNEAPMLNCGGPPPPLLPPVPSKLAPPQKGGH